MAMSAVIAGTSCASALEIVPVVNATLMGGQYIFRGDRSDLGVNAGLVAAPTIRQSEQWSYLPIYAGNYSGTKGVNDGVAAGTLYQQEMDHRVSFTAIDSVPGTNWRLKPSASYKYEFLKETKDEQWGRGLFDYEKIGLGFEAENVYKDPFSYRLGLDLYRIRFPNFQSLESTSGTDPLGNPLQRENAGTNVLDTYNYQLSASGAMPYPFDSPAVSLSGGYSVLYQDYHHETLVDSRGQLASATRKDFLQIVTASVGHPRKVTLFGEECQLDSSFGLNLALNLSNQNTFDASQTQFIRNSYSYVDAGLGPRVGVSWGDKKRPAQVAGALNYDRTMYLGRLAQDGGGLYTGQHLYQNHYSLALDYRYPIAEQFYLKAQANVLFVRSNNHFETTYSYNYTTENYLLGFTYDF
jgi:hypothetical protein